MVTPTQGFSVGVAVQPAATDPSAALGFNEIVRVAGPLDESLGEAVEETGVSGSVALLVALSDDGSYYQHVPWSRSDVDEKKTYVSFVSGTDEILRMVKSGEWRTVPR